GVELSRGRAGRVCGRAVRGGTVIRRDGAGECVGGLGAFNGAAGGADKDAVKRAGALPELRRDLHDDMVLVARSVDRRDLPLAKGVVERVIDLRYREAEASRGRAIDDQIAFEPLLLLVGIDFGQLGNPLQRVGDLGGPVVQFIQIVALQRVLVERVALPPADANVLHGLYTQPGAGNL